MVSMAVRVKEYTKLVLSLDAGLKGRGLTVYPDDTFLVSYPRSGNTWMRFLITNLVFDTEPTSFLNLEARMPEIYAYSDWILRGVPRPRYLKSHECFDPRYKRVIYIARDPRDVSVSYYHQLVKFRIIPDDYPMERFVEQWMEPHWYTQYGNWAEHVQSWLAMRRGGSGFLLLRYGDLQARPGEALAKVAKFLGLQRSGEQILRAIELSSADRMRALEKAQQKKWVGTRHSRMDKPFVRNAKGGDWKTALPPESAQLIESAWGPLMEELGFPIGAKALEDARQEPAAEYAVAMS